MPRPKGTPLPRKVITCDHCGGRELRSVNAVFCRKCVKKRRQKLSAFYIRRRVESDPAYALLLRAKRSMYARRERRANWPVRCAMCSTEVHILKGRHLTNALCPRCQVENRQATRVEAYRRAA